MVPAAIIPAMPERSTEHMQCMEIWGGNQPADRAVVLAGLDAWVYCRPFGQAQGGGDVYYVSSCATGRVTRLLLADVSGHGAVVARTAMDLRWLMQRYVNFIDQTDFVRSMNQQFGQLSTNGSFATAVVATFFAPTNDLTLCIAGHPPPLLYRARHRRWGFLNQAGQASNIPLGIEENSDWAQFAVELEVGDMVLCYTDSLIEAKGPDGAMLGLNGLLDVLSSIDLSNPQGLINALLHAITSGAEKDVTGDDVTVLLFSPNGLAPQVALKDKVCAPLRVLKALAGSVLPGRPPAPWPELSLTSIGGAVFGSLNRRRRIKSLGRVDQTGR